MRPASIITKLLRNMRRWPITTARQPITTTTATTKKRRSTRPRLTSIAKMQADTAKLRSSIPKSRERPCTVNRRSGRHLLERGDRYAAVHERIGPQHNQQPTAFGLHG